MPYCAVLECKNDSRTKNVVNGGISYHRFSKTPDVKEKWIDATGRQNWFPTKTSTICSDHFIEEDFLIKSGRKYLVDTAVPKQKIIYFQSGTANTVPSSETVSLHIQRKKTHDDENIMKSPCNNEQTLDTNADPSSANSMCPKELQQVIKWKESKIKKQDLIIRRLRAKTRRLEKKVNKIENILKTIEEKFPMVNLISLKNK